jgi:hypothetical protein
MHYKFIFMKKKNHVKKKKEKQKFSIRRRNLTKHNLLVLDFYSKKNISA